VHRHVKFIAAKKFFRQWTTIVINPSYATACLVRFPRLEPECARLELEHCPTVLRSRLPELVQPEVAPSTTGEGEEEWHR
jgi:hypothetical protein